MSAIPDESVFHISPLVFEGFDCVTFVESVLALSLSDTFDNLSFILEKLRYKDAQFSWEYRNHFMETEWIFNNSRLFESVKGLTNSCIWIDHKTFYNNNLKVLPIDIPKRVYICLPYFSDETLKEKPQIEDGVYLTLVIGNRDWIMTEHTGFCIIDDSNFTFFHASSKAGKVESVDFIQYLGSGSDKKGVSLLKIRSMF
jgi:hypothetical protein